MTYLYLAATICGILLFFIGFYLGKGRGKKQGRKEEAEWQEEWRAHEMKVAPKMIAGGKNKDVRQGI